MEKEISQMIMEEDFIVRKVLCWQRNGHVQEYRRLRQSI